MSMQKNGVAPDWVSIGNAAYTIPEGSTCVGFYVETEGTVTFTSGGVAITPNFGAGTFVPARVTNFSGGGTATAVYALLAK